MAKTIKSGDYFDASVWDTGRVPGNELIDINHNLTVNNRNIWLRSGAKLTTTTGRGSLIWTNVNEAAFRGSGIIDGDGYETTFPPDDPTGYVGSDIGLWITDDAVIDLVGGVYKKPFTFANNTLLKGTKQFSVKDATGWAVGDEIVVCTTDKPDGAGLDWNDNANASVDPFLNRFERVKIVAVSGNTVTLDRALLFDHFQLYSAKYNKYMNVCIANNSRAFKIGGVKGNRPHLFIKSSKPSRFENIEFTFMGPRRGGPRPDLWLGRYALHFHHAGEGTRGSVVKNNVFHDLGNRGLVIHGSHGVDVLDNVIGFFQNNAFWYDPGHSTHDMKVLRNLAYGVVWNGDRAGNSSGFEIGQGDDNIFEDNYAIYCKVGLDEHTGGGFVWAANNEGVAIFKRNISVSNFSGLFVWQNTGNNHMIEDWEAWNNYIAGMQGAYINSYVFRNCFFYNSLLRVKATPGNTDPMFNLLRFDAAGMASCVELLTSPVAAGVPNAFRECDFQNYSKQAVLMKTEFDKEANGPKGCDLVSCTFSGAMYGYTPASIYNSFFRIQPKSGQPVRVTQNGVTNIAVFAPSLYGTGEGLKGEYFNGSNFEQKAFTREAEMVKHQQWTKDPGASPSGVHHTIKGDLFSVRWTGFIQPHYTEDITLVVQSWGGIRIWVDDVKILDRWAEQNDASYLFATPFKGTAGKKHKIVMEHFNNSGGRGCILYWRSPSGNEIRNVPISQLYPPTTTAPTVYYNKEISKTFTRNNCPANHTPGSVVYRVIAGKYTSAVSQADADQKATADLEQNGQNAANTSGTCTVPVPPTNPCDVVDEVYYRTKNPDVDAAIKGGQFRSGQHHFDEYGKKEGRYANKACEPTAPPPVKEIGRATVDKYTLIVFSNDTYKVEKK